MLEQRQKDQVIDLCQKLIQEKSYSGQEAGVAKVLKDFFIDQGFDLVEVDHYGNIYGVMKGNRPG